MADFNNSPNMNLPVPVVGVAPGPAWATLINSCLTLLDGHSHLAGFGVPITVDALDINADLSLNSNNLVSTRSVRMIPQGAPLALISDLGCIYVSGIDLYYNDVNGAQVRITQAGSVSGTPGSISNLVSPASASYVAGNNTFVWQSGANLPAIMDSAYLIIRNLAVSSPGLTLSAPAAMAIDYEIVLPSLPAVTSFVEMDVSGNLTASTAVTDILSALMPTGSIMAYGGAAAPSGPWLLCDGSSVSRATFAALFAAIGTAYGTANGTTFNLPDMRGRFARGVSGASGNDPDAAARAFSQPGGNTGNNVGSYQGSTFSSHDHGGGNHAHTVNTVSNSGGPDRGIVQYTALQPSITGINLGASGGTNASGPVISLQGGSENRPDNVYVNYIIKY